MIAMERNSLQSMCFRLSSIPLIVHWSFLLTLFVYHRILWVNRKVFLPAKFNRKEILRVWKMTVNHGQFIPRVHWIRPILGGRIPGYTACQFCNSIVCSPTSSVSCWTVQPSCFPCIESRGMWLESGLPAVILIWVRLLESRVGLSCIEGELQIARLGWTIGQWYFGI